MSEPRQAPDELELKKRARRRLVGAVAFATFAAVVLPMVMDETPPPSGRDIELRIPGQDQLSSSPVTGSKPATEAPAKAPVPAAAAPAPATTVVPAPVKPTPEPLAKPAADATRPAVSPVPGKPEAKPAEAKAETRPVADAKRAQAILDGQPGDAHVILIGAFANPANVKNLQTKLGQLGIKTYTENLDSPQGRKTRVRAGPFANREAAEKALDKMKRIGVGGVVAARP